MQRVNIVVKTEQNERTTREPANCVQDQQCLYLRFEEYSLWDRLVLESAQGNVFCSSWWLTAVGGESQILGYFSPGRLIAGIPLFLSAVLTGAECYARYLHRV